MSIPCGCDEFGSIDLEILPIDIMPGRLIQPGGPQKLLRVARSSVVPLVEQFANDLSVEIPAP